jgi:hypothetical protein
MSVPSKSPDGRDVLSDDLNRLRIMTHSPTPYSPNAGRKIAPVVPPKPKKPSTVDEPTSVVRKDPPAYHEPHIFDTPSQYFCVAAPQAPVPSVGCTIHPTVATSRSAFPGGGGGGVAGVPNGSVRSAAEYHQATPVRVDDNNSSIISGVAPPPVRAVERVSTVPTYQNLSAGVAPPNYADLSTYSGGTDYSNLANYANSSNYSNLSNYADYDHLNSAGSK